jgi:hypothetical protein
MRPSAEKVFYYHADANSLGGFISHPFQKIVPSQASVALPAVGGFATTRTGAFNFEELVSCRTAYTRVSGGQAAPGAPFSTVVTSVVEGLNILELITAERIVAQISVDYPLDGGLPQVSFTGSHFEGLKIGGCVHSLTLDSKLQECGRPLGASRPSISWPLFQETGAKLAAKLNSDVEKADDGDEFRWLTERYGWMASDREQKACGSVLCSLVESIAPGVPGRSFAHVLEVPEFGRLFFAEIVAFPASVQLSMIRAELGCGVGGKMNAAHAAVNGAGYPP